MVDDMLMRDGQPMAMMAFSESAVGSVPEVSALEKPTRIRKQFPETWLWKSQDTLYVLLS